MPQVKVYGHSEQLDQCKAQIMAGINASFMETMAMAAEKIVYRFFSLTESDFYYGGDRTAGYLVVEIAVFAGRSQDVKTALVEAIFSRIQRDLQLAVVDLEILLWELPAGNWGLRGSTGDQLNRVR